jgi:hypothetical protein
MITQPIELEKKVNELLDVLRDDIENMKQNLQKLNKLRLLVVKRDNAALETMLNQIRAEAGLHEANESRRKAARGRIGEILKCKPDQVTLSRLEGFVADEQKIEIGQIQTELRNLIRKLSGEHKSTIALMAELERFNRLLLDNIFEKTKVQSVTYNPSGTATRYGDSAFVSFHL